MKNTKVLINKLSFFNDIIIKYDIKSTNISPRKYSQFIHLFSSLKDFRIKKKCSYKLENLMLIIFLAKMAEEGDSCTSIARYAYLKKDELFSYGILKKNENGEIMIPSHDCFRYFLMNFDSNELKEAFINRIVKFMNNIYTYNENPGKYSLLSIDGQEFKGSGRSLNSKNPQGNIATLNIFDDSSYVCLYSEPISKKESEITSARSILTYLDLSKKIITADALHTQSDTARLIIHRKGNYVFRVKENQKGLLDEIIALFKKGKKIETIDTDLRTIEILYLSPSYIGTEFPGQKAYIKVTSKQNSNKGDILYFVSSLKDSIAIKEAIENRWDIENGLHKGKDFYLNEDEFHLKDKTSVANFSIINNIILSLFKIAHNLFNNKELIMTRKTFKFKPMETLQLLMTLISTSQLSKLIKEKLQ